MFHGVRYFLFYFSHGSDMDNPVCVARKVQRSTVPCVPKGKVASKTVQRRVGSGDGVRFGETGAAGWHVAC